MQTPHEQCAIVNVSDQGAMDMVKEVEHCKVKHSKTSKASNEIVCLMLLLLLVMNYDYLFIPTVCICCALFIVIVLYGCKSM